MITAPFPFVFLSNLFNTNKVFFVANLSKTSLAKGTTRSDNTFLPKLLNVLPRNPPDLIILAI